MSTPNYIRRPLKQMAILMLILNLGACALVQKGEESIDANEKEITTLEQDKPQTAPMIMTGKKQDYYGAKPKGTPGGTVGITDSNAPSDGKIVAGEQNRNAEPDFNTEGYDLIQENPFLEVLKNPLSTFSIDVDTASYSNMRRFITQNHKLPPKDAVRIEELVNYFPYTYPEPDGSHPFSVTTDVAICPWNSHHALLRVGLQGKKINLKQTPPNNLVFLLDVSGSMIDENKLPLLKQSLRMLVNELREEDTIAITVYAGAAGMVLPPTSAAKKHEILAALDNLEAGGSTAGEAGIKLAYEIAKKHFKTGGNNRVILATDGDFNVGPSSDGELVRLIEDKRKDGIYLTVLGFGMGNYKDSKMEKLADTGNGNYAYIDNLLEAKKVLVTEMGGTLLTIAKDVKLQLEFNPAKVASYRLIGYENRLLRAEDFNNDAKDAGELGAGHNVTALYEMVPASEGSSSAHDLRYQQTIPKISAASSNEWVNVKLRYKPPHSDTSLLLSQVVSATPAEIHTSPTDLRFAAAVAGFGLVLRDSEYKGDWNLTQTLELARGAKGEDEKGYRQDFIALVEQANQLKMANK